MKPESITSIKYASNDSNAVNQAENPLHLLSVSVKKTVQNYTINENEVESIA